MAPCRTWPCADRSACSGLRAALPGLRLRGVLHPAFPHASAGHLASYAKLARCSTPRRLHVHGTARHGTTCTARHGTAGSARTAGLAAVLRDLCPGAALRVHLGAHARACISVHARAPEEHGPDWRAHERLFGRSLPTYEWKETVGSISFSGHRSNSSPASRATTPQPPNAPTDDELREDDLLEALGELQPAAPAAWVAA